MINVLIIARSPRLLQRRMQHRVVNLQEGSQRNLLPGSFFSWLPCYKSVGFFEKRIPMLHRNSTLAGSNFEKYFLHTNLWGENSCYLCTFHCIHTQEFIKSLFCLHDSRCAMHLVLHWYQHGSRYYLFPVCVAFAALSVQVLAIQLYQIYGEKFRIFAD